MGAGKGIARKAEAKPASTEAATYFEQYESSTAETAKFGKVVLRDKMKDGKPVWKNTPSVEAQLHRFPKTCLFEKPRVDIFDLADPESLEAYNKILAATDPPVAPSVLIEQQERVFDKHGSKNFKMFIQYRKVLYKQLIREEGPK